MRIRDGASTGRRNRPPYLCYGHLVSLPHHVDRLFLLGLALQTRGTAKSCTMGLHRESCWPHRRDRYPKRFRQVFRSRYSKNLPRISDSDSLMSWLYPLLVLSISEFYTRDLPAILPVITLMRCVLYLLTLTDCHSKLPAILQDNRIDDLAALHAALRGEARQILAPLGDHESAAARTTIRAVDS